MKGLLHFPSGITGTFLREVKPTGKPLTTHIQSYKGVFFAPSSEFIECEVGKGTPIQIMYNQEAIRNCEGDVIKELIVYSMINHHKPIEYVNHKITTDPLMLIINFIEK